MADSLKAIRENQTCDICLEGEKPYLKSLPCGHPLCQSCLEKLLVGKSNLECPFCRASTPIKTDWIAKTSNIYKGQISCHSCLKLRECEDIWWCKDCYRFICSYCQLTTHGPSHRGHEVKSYLKEGAADAVNSVMNCQTKRKSMILEEKKTKYIKELKKAFGPVIAVIAQEHASIVKEEYVKYLNEYTEAFCPTQEDPVFDSQMDDDEASSIKPVLMQLMQLANMKAAPTIHDKLRLKCTTAELRDKLANLVEIDCVPVTSEPQKWDPSNFSISGRNYNFVKNKQLYSGVLPDSISLMGSSFPKTPKLEPLDIVCQLGEEVENIFQKTAIDETEYGIMHFFVQRGPANNWRIRATKVADQSGTNSDRCYIFNIKNIDRLETLTDVKISISISEKKEIPETRPLFLALNTNLGSRIASIEFRCFYGFPPAKATPTSCCNPKTWYKSTSPIESFSVLHSIEGGCQPGSADRVAIIHSEDTSKLLILGPHSTEPGTLQEMEEIQFSGSPLKFAFFAGNPNKARLVIQTQEDSVCTKEIVPVSKSVILNRVKLPEGSRLAPVDRTTSIVLDPVDGSMRMIKLL